MPALPGKTAHATDVFFYAKLEAAFDTRSSWAGTDAVAILGDLKLEPAKPKARTKERIGTSSAQRRVRAGLQAGKWSASFYIKPAAAGTKPDFDPLLEATFSNDASVVAMTSCTYSFASDAPKSLQLGKRVGVALYEIANGCWVEQLVIEFLNGEFKLTFSGGFASFVRMAGAEVAAGGASATDDMVPYKLAHKGNIKAGSVVAFGALNNAGAGYTVTAVDDTQNPPELTIDPVLEDDVAEHDQITPVTPSQTLGGTVLEFVEGAVALDGGSDMDFVQAKVTINTGIYGAAEASSPRPSRLLKGERNVEAEVQLYFTDHETGPFLARGSDESDATVGIALRMGSEAGLRFKVNIPNMEADVVPIELPDDNTAAMFLLKGLALQNAAEYDETTVVLD